MKALKLRIALLAALLLAPPLAAAQGAGEPRVFLVQGTRVDDGVLVIRVLNAHFTVHTVFVTLLVDGALAGSEQKVDVWEAQASRELRFALPQGDAATLKLHYSRPDSRAQEESITVKLPEGARVVVADARLVDGRTAVVTLENAGGRRSGETVVWLAEAGEGKARVGDPLQRRVAGLAPGEKAEARFALPSRLGGLRVHVEHDGRESDTDVSLRAPEPARVEVVSAEERDGNATLRLANVGGEPTGTLRVALEDLQGLRIGSPLSRTVASLAPGEEADVTFAVPASTEKVKVVLEEGGGAEPRSVQVRLGDVAGGSGSSVELTTDLPSREGEPGGSVSYTLRLSNEGAERLATLRADGLPDGYEARFAVDGSATTSVLLPESGERAVVVTLRIPESAGRDAGRTLRFNVTAAVEGEPPATVPLEVTVRGQGKLEVQGQNWFTTLQPGAAQELTITVRNTGSAPLRDVTPDSSKPTGWRVTFDPPTLDRLDPGQARNVKATVEAPSDVGSGRYVLDVSAASGDVVARPRSLSVEVEGESSSSLGWLVGAGLAALVGVALVVKLRRR